ncbi:MAG: hypothetical protein HC880_19890 [Bacteroidia bacterium]|nr:hypothetical protein [Bacteroidia bacterium]
MREVPLAKQALFAFRDHIAEQAQGRPVLLFLNNEQVEDFVIQSLDASLSQQNDLFAWLFQQNLKTYIISVSQTRLDNYVFFDLIAEVAQRIEAEKLLASGDVQEMGVSPV